MLDFIAKYWLEFVFGLISSGLICWVKYDIKQFQKRQARDRDDFKKEVEDEVQVKIDQTEAALRKADTNIEASIEVVTNQIENLTAGVLSLQGKEFRARCHELLAPDHVITLDEFEEITEDHDAYNGLGGNHKGDLLFNAVVEKFKSQVTK